MRYQITRPFNGGIEYAMVSARDSNADADIATSHDDGSLAEAP